MELDYKVGDYVTNKSDGWLCGFRVCKITSRTVWLWIGGQTLDRPVKKDYFSFRWPEDLKKMTFGPKHETVLAGYGITNIRPFRKL